MGFLLLAHLCLEIIPIPAQNRMLHVTQDSSETTAARANQLLLTWLVSHAAFCSEQG